jgi:dienelactone hydrolase
MRTLTGIVALVCLSSHAPAFANGTVQFEPRGDQANVPERYRLTSHTFAYELERKADLPSSGVERYHLRFPSPVTSDCPENNTVHAEYYRPKGDGPFPGVIVLDITAGDQSLSRGISTLLAQRGVASLFVQMAYYGPRRPPGSKLRLLSPNTAQTIEAIRQTVLDVRRATAWLESRAEIDPRRLGIVGTSLGSMIGALCAEMEPKLERVVVLLGGGGLVDAYWDDPRAAPFRRLYEALGGTKEAVAKLIAPVDPLTCAANLREHKVLIIAGKKDDIVPPKATVALWEASGKQKIVWYNCTHYGAALYFLPAMRHVTNHFAAE